MAWLVMSSCLVLLKNRRVEGLMHVKSVEVQNPPRAWCRNSESQFRCCPRHLTKVQNYEVLRDTRNRWRDGQVCPDVDKELWRLRPDGSVCFGVGQVCPDLDKELWRLGPDGSGVFWRVMHQ
ncbi:hypothetical protein TNCV_3767351 [Trichonephila clavipes]|nr:hypothetical protein TNCV_3767351 [Trichonephila clavipes]